MHFTLSQAAKAAGSSKSTINRALSSGRLSGERQPDGSYRIEASELFRAFPAKGSGTSAAEPKVPGGEPAAEPAERMGGDDVLLRLELRLVRDTLEREREDRERERTTAEQTVADLRERLDAEQEERRALQRQLMAPVVPVPEPSQERAEPVPGGHGPTRTGRGFLSRLWGR